MNVHVTYDGTIKLDNHVVGHVYHDPGIDDPDALVWHWTAHVNGTPVYSDGDFVRWYAFDCAKRECEREAKVIR